MSILVIAEHDNQALGNATLHTLGAARRLGEEVAVLVVGQNCGTVADEVAEIEGIARVLLVEAPQYEKPTAEALAGLVLTIVGDYSHVLVAATTFGKNFMPRVAAKLDVAQISDIVDIESPDVFMRPIYAGNAIATVRSKDSVKVVTVRAAAFDPVASSGGNAPVERLEALEVPAKSRVINQQLTQSTRPELASARVVVAGGRGLGSLENFRILDRLADKLGAALGASRAAVDAGYAPNDYQVGQTGKIVAPDLYIAIGISGAIQHLAGMSASRVIVAINKDADAPIFEVADYGLVEDLFKVLPELEAALPG